MRDLEKKLQAVAAALDRRHVTPTEALRQCIDAFTGAGELIGPDDIQRLFGGGAPPAGAMCQSTILTGGYPVAGAVQ